jgi:hypothetical protein
MAAPMVGQNQRSRFAACLAFQMPTTRLASRAALSVIASRARFSSLSRRRSLVPMSGSCGPAGIGQVVGVFVVPRVPLPATLPVWPKPVCASLTAERAKPLLTTRIARDDGSVLPTKKPPMLSAKQR